MTDERVEVAIVGGGPAGAVARRAARPRGHEVVVLERAPAWRWRAGGVFASPAAVAALRAAGLDAAIAGGGGPADPGDARRDAGRDDVPPDVRRRAGGEPAVGFDRSRARPGPARPGPRGRRARCGRGWRSPTSTSDVGRLDVRGPDGTDAIVRATVVVGADGAALGRRAGGRRRPPGPAGAALGLTYHLADPTRSGRARDARMRDRPRRLRRDRARAGRPGERRDRARSVVAGRARARRRAGGRATGIVAAIPPTADDPAAWRHGAPLDAVAGRLAARPPRRRGAPGRAGCWSAMRPGSWIRSPGRASTGRSCRPSSAAAAIGARVARGPTGALRRLRARDDAAGSWRRTPSRGSSRRSWPARRCSSTPPGGSPSRPDGPCDDGPRDGRPRPGRPRARPALPRRAARAVSEAERPTDDASPPTRSCRDDGRPDPAVPQRAVGRAEQRLDAAGRRPRLRRGARRSRSSASSSRGDRATAARSTDLARRLRPDLSDERTTASAGLHAIRIVYAGPDHRRRAARRAPTARPTRVAWFTLDEARPPAISASWPPHCPRAGSARRRASDGTMHSTIGIDVAAPPELVFAPRPRRRALGTAAPPLRPLDGRVERRPDGSLVADFVARRPLVAVLGLGLPVAWRSRTWTEPDDAAPAVRPRRRARRAGWT